MINLQITLDYINKLDCLKISHHIISAKSCYIADTMHNYLAVKAIYHYWNMQGNNIMLNETRISSVSCTFRMRTVNH